MWLLCGGRNSLDICVGIEFGLVFMWRSKKTGL